MSRLHEYARVLNFVFYIWFLHITCGSITQVMYYLGDSNFTLNFLEVQFFNFQCPEYVCIDNDSGCIMFGGIDSPIKLWS